MAIYRHLDSAAVTVKFSNDGEHRYWLKIEHPSNGPKTVCAVMENPSYARKEVADKSVQFLERLVFQKEYPEFKSAGTLIVVNLFSFIQTNDFKGDEDKYDTETDRYLRKGITEADVILLAWGKTANYPERIATVKSMVKEAGKTEVYETKTHPSRGTYEDFIVKVTDL